MMRRMDVYEATEKRLKIIFDYFDYVYVSFSGGKDSGVLSVSYTHLTLPTNREV